MVRRVVLLMVVCTIVEWGAFRWLHRDLFWIAAPAAAQAPVAATRETATTALARRALSRRFAEALATATDRDGLRDLHLATLARLADDHSDDPAILLRYADQLRLQGRPHEAARVFTRVAEAR